jgi:hypothetical protein
MAKSVEQQIKEAMAKKVVGRTTEIYKAVVLGLYKETIKKLGVTQPSGVECASQPVGPRREDTL